MFITINIFNKNYIKRDKKICLLNFIKTPFSQINISNYMSKKLYSG